MLQLVAATVCAEPCDVAWTLRHDVNGWPSLWHLRSSLWLRFGKQPAALPTRPEHAESQSPQPGTAPQQGPEPSKPRGALLNR